ncbi:MFS transporter [Baekduia soli]|uniref:MFS transporter n=1 Tax=Baekduia soli TaxID=496014 RepID=UPI00165215F4|nr:MFS transporter [Baekduia soli]
MAWSGHLGVLRERPYRLLFAGQAVSLFGDAMVDVALAFAVIKLGASPAQLGLVFTARSIAMVAALLAGGVLADRLDRRAILVACDLVRLAAQGALAAALIAGHPAIWVLAALSAVTGAATGVFNPTSTGFLPSVVSAEGLQPANALRGLSASAGRMAGPVLSGVLVATVGAGWALAADAATFALSAAFLGRIPAIARTGPAAATSYLADLREGWQAFRSRTWLWAFVAWASFSNMLFGCWTVVGPLTAERDLGGAAAWGAILGASGVGGLIGGVLALRLRPQRPLVFSVLAFAIFFLPLALLALGLPVVPVAAGALVGEIGLVLTITVWESTLQRHVAPAVLSRVSAYDWFGSLAFQPLGLALWGPVAATIGYHGALWVAFVGHLAGVAVILTVRDVRRLPPVPRPTPG